MDITLDNILSEGIFPDVSYDKGYLSIEIGDRKIWIPEYPIDMMIMEKNIIVSIKKPGGSGTEVIKIAKKGYNVISSGNRKNTLFLLDSNGIYEIKTIGRENLEGRVIRQYVIYYSNNKIMRNEAVILYNNRISNRRYFLRTVPLLYFDGNKQRIYTLIVMSNSIRKPSRVFVFEIEKREDNLLVSPYDYVENSILSFVVKEILRSGELLKYKYQSVITLFYYENPGLILENQIDSFSKTAKLRIIDLNKKEYLEFPNKLFFPLRKRYNPRFILDFLRIYLSEIEEINGYPNSKKCSKYISKILKSLSIDIKYLPFFVIPKNPVFNDVDNESKTVIITNYGTISISNGEVFYNLKQGPVESCIIDLEIKAIVPSSEFNQENLVLIPFENGYKP